MNLPGPLFVVGSLLAAAAGLQILRRLTLIVAWASATVAGAIAVFVTIVPLDQTVDLGPISVTLGAPLSILGRVVVIEPVDRLPLTLIALIASVLFLVAWRLLPRSNFFAAGLAILALLSGALMVEQVVYAALLVEIAALLAIFPLAEPIVDEQGNRYSGGARGGLQYMVYTTLALPGLMITQLLLEQFTVFPNDLGLLQTATILLAFSFALLLGAVPFQSWMSAVAMDGSPPMVTFLFTVNLGAVWFLLLAYLETYSWLSAQAAFGQLFTLVGLIMMVAGGTLAATQDRLGRIVGYATLVDNGAMFVALGSRHVTGLSLSIMMLIARPLSLGLMALGLDGLRRLGQGDDRAETLAGTAWQVPWRTLAFVMGGISMAGFPLSLAFAARWGLYRLLAGANLFQAVLALLSSAGVMMGLINIMRLLLTPSRTMVEVGATDEGSPDGPRVRREDPVVLAMILALLVGTIVLGLFPQLVSGIAFQMAEEFTFLSQ